MFCARPVILVGNAMWENPQETSLLVNARMLPEIKQPELQAFTQAMRKNLTVIF
jgi:hypothetical protein